MPETKTFNLFVYGTLMNSSVFRAVLGRRLATRKAHADNVETFHARRAILSGYEKISPDNTYLYAVPDPQGRIRGYLVSGLPHHCAATLRNYEGRNYVKKKVKVLTASGPERAIAYIGNLKHIERSFGYEFRDHFKQEIILDRKIDAALVEVEREQLHTAEEISRRAIAELRGDKIRDLKRKHFESGGISDYVIRRSIKDEPLPDYADIIAEPEGAALAPNYLTMVIRQVIFNGLEERLHHDFRYELDRMDRGQVYYDRALSSLAALRMTNSQADVMKSCAAECLDQLDFRKHHLVDFVKWAVRESDSIYEASAAKTELDFIRNHMGSGDTPLGAELEFSNIGHEVIRDPQGRLVRDAQYDSFLYFREFGLNVLTWRLGGHLDDHHKKSTTSKRRGFFEVALGNLSVEANLSKPITDDPWLLNQFIQQTRTFYEITPHSVHISLQIQGRRPARDRLLPMAAMKCLFALAGDPAQQADGRIVIRRLISDEIITNKPEPHILFSQTTKRHSAHHGSAAAYVRTSRTRGRYVQQYKFLRLGPDLNYEPIIMALKGIQMSLAPGSLLTSTQYANSAKHRDMFTELGEWGAAPTSLSYNDIEEFLSAVYDGLMGERRGKPAHSGAYIAWTINRLRAQLATFNRLIDGEENES